MIALTKKQRLSREQSVMYGSVNDRVLRSGNKTTRRDRITKYHRPARPTRIATRNKVGKIYASLSSTSYCDSGGVGVRGRGAALESPSGGVRPAGSTRIMPIFNDDDADQHEDAPAGLLSPASSPGNMPPPASHYNCHAQQLSGGFQDHNSTENKKHIFFATTIEVSFAPRAPPPLANTTSIAHQPPPPSDNHMVNNLLLGKIMLGIKVPCFGNEEILAKEGIKIQIVNELVVNDELGNQYLIPNKEFETPSFIHSTKKVEMSPMFKDPFNLILASSPMYARENVQNHGTETNSTTSEDFHSPQSGLVPCCGGGFLWRREQMTAPGFSEESSSSASSSSSSSSSSHFK